MLIMGKSEPFLEFFCSYSFALGEILLTQESCSASVLSHGLSFDFPVFHVSDSFGTFRYSSDSILSFSPQLDPALDLAFGLLIPSPAFPVTICLLFAPGISSCWDAPNCHGHHQTSSPRHHHLHLLFFCPMYFLICPMGHFYLMPQECWTSSPHGTF